MDNQQYDDILKEEKLQVTRVGIKVVIIVLAILACLHQFDIFDVARMARGISAMGVFVAEMAPPDFSDARSWIIPLCDTLAMCVGGTALSILLSLTLALLATANSSHRAVHILSRSILCLLRAVPT
jgi:ABC-type phosphate/phosphonate transport system, permease component